MKGSLDRYIIGAVIVIFIALIVIIYKANRDEFRFIDDDNTVAEINGEIITVDDLRLNYEFGFPHLKKGATQRQRIENYLNLMINEKIISLEGYELGIDKNEMITEWENKLRKELVLEELIENEIAGKIKIDDEELKNEINKSKVTFKFRYWAEPNLERAEYVKSLMDKEGYADVVEEINNLSTEIKIDPKKLETDYLSYADITPEILTAIKDLPAGDISEPVFINGNYFLFQVLDIRRMSVTTNEYKSKASSVYKSIYNRKLQNAVVNYVDGLLTPKKITTKREAFNLLYSAVSEWKSSDSLKYLGFAHAVNTADNETSKLFEIRKSFNDTVVYYNGGSYSLKEFLNIFEPRRIKAGPSDAFLFGNELNTLIAVSVRDELLYEHAAGKGYDSSEVIEEKLKEWKDQWVFQLTRNKFLDDVGSNIDSSLQSTEKSKRVTKTFERMINSLKTQYNITINRSVLDTLKTIDFKKSRWASVQVYKGGTGRPVVPLVDPSWNQLINN
ncbi:MAG: hypothetical protein PVH88_05890 [Ignavibacteria bacterium]|jgi:hypothetical protein